VDACRSLRAAGCILVALAGLPVLATLLGGDPILLASLSAGVLAAAFTGYLAQSARLGWLYYVLALPALLLGSLGLGTLHIVLSLVYAATVIGVTATGRVSPGLTSFALALPGAYTMAGGEWFGLFTVLAISSAGLAAYELSGRGHSMMFLVVAPLGALVDPLMAAAASATSLMLGFAASGLIEKSGCPFTIDSGMTFVGVILSVVAGVLGLVWGFDEAGPAFILWIIGFIFIEAGVLVPVRAFQHQHA